MIHAEYMTFATSNIHELTSNRGSAPARMHLPLTIEPSVYDCFTGSRPRITSSSVVSTVSTRKSDCFQLGKPRPWPLQTLPTHEVIFLCIGIRL